MCLLRLSSRDVLDLLLVQWRSHRSDTTWMAALDEPELPAEETAAADEDAGLSAVQKRKKEVGPNPTAADTAKGFK